MNLHLAKKIVTLVIGLTVILFGVLLLFVPGPGLAIMVAGLAILATEFVWARRWLGRLRTEAVNVGTRFVGDKRMKKALGEDFVNNSRKKADQEDTVHETGSSEEAIHEDEIVEPAAVSACDSAELNHEHPLEKSEADQVHSNGHTKSPVTSRTP